ncbi:pseudoazurin [Paracoccus sp. CPCC 101403]|uniref:Pseudoazurin n=1 Tax=Paracoccus broussonetiae TaxID=3075834 RepID=A0ABU3EHQ4_9RHOB|nr:pseudoazurin [Paracoccus sp. CPCC 101403]MDT1063759.1 pseudoazurin [Paracoccus sp. CPCC 101403]
MKYLLLPLMLLANPALAEIHEIRMLNRGDSGPMVYEPSYLNIAPGDTVRFLPTQPGHNAATIDGMLPPGAEPFKSKINDSFEITLSAPGAYGVKCSPHYAMGMVMLIEVGASSEVALPDGLPKRTAERFAKIIAEREQTQN